MCVRRKRAKIIIILFNPGVSSSPAKWPPRQKVTKIGSKRSKVPRRDALLIVLYSVSVLRGVQNVVPKSFKFSLLPTDSVIPDHVVQ
jgi:hypothetical protein